MQEMISMLDVEAGMKILEIGSGTGYNAALLAQLAGAENVTTVEVDPNIADHARSAQHKAGFPVTVITGDGASGHPEHAPYDRVIATASVRDIPYTWVAQCRDSGRILLPWGSNLDEPTLAVAGWKPSALDVEPVLLAGGRDRHACPPKTRS